MSHLRIALCLLTMMVMLPFVLTLAALCYITDNTRYRVSRIMIRVMVWGGK